MAKKYGYTVEVGGYTGLYSSLDAALQRARGISKGGCCDASVEPAVGIENGDGIRCEVQGLLFPH